MFWLKPQMVSVWASISVCYWVKHSHTTFESRFGWGGTSVISAVNEEWSVFVCPVVFVQPSTEVKSVSRLISWSVMWKVKHKIKYKFLIHNVTWRAVDSQESVCGRSSLRQPERSTVAGRRSCFLATAPTHQATAACQSSSVTWEETQRELRTYWKISPRSIHWGNQAWCSRYSIWTELIYWCCESC